jgi:hypothetical protein
LNHPLSPRLSGLIRVFPTDESIVQFALEHLLEAIETTIRDLGIVPSSTSVFHLSLLCCFSFFFFFSFLIFWFVFF